MSLATSAATTLLGAVAGGIVSGKVAREQIETQYNLQNKRERRDWYKRANELAELASSDWYDVMTRGEVDHKVNATENFRTDGKHYASTPP